MYYHITLKFRSLLLLNCCANFYSPHLSKTDNRLSITDQPCTDQFTSFAPSTLPVEVQQTPETDMNTSSDSDADSVVHELPTGQQEKDEVSVTDTDQACTEEQNYRLWCTFLHGHTSRTLMQISPVLITTLLLHPNNSQCVK